MKQYSMHLQPAFFNLIKSGEKTIELRAWDDKRRQIVPGDEIVFRTDGTDETMPVQVTHLVVARDFESLFEIIDVKKSGFETADVAIKNIETFFNKSEQQKTGVVGIVVEKL